jgi:hypothetical protein
MLSKKTIYITILLFKCKAIVEHYKKSGPSLKEVQSFQQEMNMIIILASTRIDIEIQDISKNEWGILEEIQN